MRINPRDEVMLNRVAKLFETLRRVSVGGTKMHVSLMDWQYDIEALAFVADWDLRVHRKKMEQLQESILEEMKRGRSEESS